MRGCSRSGRPGLGLKGGSAGFEVDAPSEEPTPLPRHDRRKKLRFHPRQLYLSVKQGELQKVILMLCEYSTYSFVLQTLSNTGYVPDTGLRARSAATEAIVLALKYLVW